MNDLRRLNFHHLHYFWSVAKEGHLTRAARQLHVSQSALSAQIRQLEEQLGHELFIREGRALRLTDVGSVVLEYAEGIFGLGQELLAAVGGDGAEATPPLRVGAVATLSRNFQDNLLRPLLGREDVQLVLQSGSLEELLERLAIHRLDLVLSNRPVVAGPQQPWRCRRIARQGVSLVGPPRLDQDAFRFPDDMEGIRLLLPGPSSDIRTQFDQLCEDHALRPRVHAEVDDMALLRLLTRDSGGVAVVPEVVVQDELRSGTLARYCTLPGVEENFYAITTRRHMQPRLLEALLPEIP
ncbi:LysR family transcriptional regulator [Ectothiorhodospiraceae bacterium WFHF3C12]|nr:LysR family transcriptional regulator [Ectothiorhodospiraceae bacterium WFHF3C12]